MIEVLQIVVAALGVAGAFETFSNVSLLWKLVALGVSGLLVINVAGAALASWAKPVRSAGFGAAVSTRSPRRFILGSIILFVIAFLTGAAAWGLMHFYGIEVAEVPSPKDSLEARIRGAVPVTARLLVLLPPGAQAKCFPKDPTSDIDRRAQVTFLSPDSPVPQLEITGFRYPQTVGVVCSPNVGLNSIIVRPEPMDVEVFRPDRVLHYHLIIVLLGGALWLIGTVLFWRRSR